MHRRAVKRLPVVDPADGTILGIVSRTDLLKVFLRDDAEIARELREDVIRRTLWIDPDTIRILVRDGIVTMEGQVEHRDLRSFLERLVLSRPREWSPSITASRTCPMTRRPTRTSRSLGSRPCRRPIVDGRERSPFPSDPAAFGSADGRASAPALGGARVALNPGPSARGSRSLPP